MGAVDDYLATLDPTARAALEHVRGLVTEVAPDIGQGTSYGMATLMWRDKPLLAMLAAKRHLSVFPFSSTVVTAVRERLAGFSLSSGTIRFSAEQPLPDDVVRDVARLRMEEIAARTKR